MEQRKGYFSLSLHAYTFALMYMLKTNELAKEFVEKNGMETYTRLLENECIEDH